MSFTRLHGFALAVAGGALLFSARGHAEPTASGPTFAAPVRISAGEALLGEERSYPSPVLHDVDGDNLPDIVVGDLMGRITFAKRIASDKGVAFAKEQPLLGRGGKPLKFQNW